MNDVNSVWLEGKVFHDPKEIGDWGLVTFTVGTSDSYTKKDGTVCYENVYLDCETNGKVADIARQIQSGMRVRVQGKIKQNKTEKDGVKRTWTKVKVFDLVILGMNPVREEDIPDETQEDFSSAVVPQAPARKRPAYKTAAYKPNAEKTPEQQAAHDAAVAKMEAKRDDISIEDVPF